MDLEEELQQVTEGDLRGIEDDLDRFRMVAVVAVGRIWHLAPRIAYARGHHTRQLTDQVLHSPEASTR